MSPVVQTCQTQRAPCQCECMSMFHGNKGLLLVQLKLLASLRREQIVLPPTDLWAYLAM